jgi:hypothetical protein
VLFAAENFYLGWVAWDARHRYRDAAPLRPAPRKPRERAD